MSIDRFFPHKIQSKNPDSEYYNKGVKWLKVKVIGLYNIRKLTISIGIEKTI